MIFDPSESRQLSGKHAAFYRESLGTMIDVFRECRDEDDGDPDWTFGVPLFDGLQWRQQMKVLLAVSSTVLEGSGDPDQWNGLEKAAVYAVYRNVFHQLEMEREIEAMDISAVERSLCGRDLDLQELDEFEDFGDANDDELSWKEMIEQAYQEGCLEDAMTPEEIDLLIAVESDGKGNLLHWSGLLEYLADRVLEDRDFENSSVLMDADRELGSIADQELGNVADHDSVDDSTDMDVSQMFEELSRLAGLDGANDEG